MNSPAVDRRRASLHAALCNVLAVGAGVAYVGAFAPLAWWPLCPLALAVLFGLWLHDSRARAARHGFLFGLGAFGVGASWVYVSIHQFGELSVWLSGAFVAVFVGVLALFPALAGLLQGCLIRRDRARQASGVRAGLVMPSIWLLVEALRGRLFGGFPWLSGGYAMIDTPLAGLAPLGGVYLVGLATLMTAGVAMALLRAYRPLLLFAAVGIGAVWFLGWLVLAAPWTQPIGRQFSVAIIQNNVALRDKWQRAQADRTLADYLRISAEQDVDVIVWPEAAVPGYYDQLTPEFHRQLRDNRADFIFGVLSRDPAQSPPKHYNSIVALGEPPQFYHKQHLVPFGEYTPLAEFLAPLATRMNIPMSNFAGWHRAQNPLRAGGTLLAASICYEAAFPQVWRAQAGDSGALINLSEDAWFGDSLAPHQRLQMARFRALESARPMIRAANNGLSAVINWRGGVDHLAPQFTQAVITANIQPRFGKTPYLIYGDRPTFILCLVLGLFGVLLGARKLGARKLR